MKLRPAALLLGFAILAVLGYWLARSAAPPQLSPEEPSAAASKSRPTPMSDEPPVKFRSADRPPASSGDPAARAEGALEGQRIIVFKDAGALERFLKNAAGRVGLLGRLDALNALRVAFSGYDDLLGLLDGEDEESFIFPVNAPAPPEGTVQPGAIALGNQLHEWLGITGENSTWGSGVRIAVLDTGVQAHSAFSGDIRSINVIDSTSGSTARNGHGTAVASVIVSGDPLTPGVAPGAELLSVRIADDDGRSDSFLLAKGIVAAVDAGAKLINISMGSFGDSALVRNAIEYARSGGSLIVAAAGNNGIGQVAYPAANDGVIAVGAVDALGSHLDFSNRGEEVDISAPGYGVNAAWTGNQAASMTGTSFSTPIVTGAIAAIMTEYSSVKLTPAQAWDKLSSYLNDGGTAGRDPLLGSGMPDIGRVLQSRTRGVYDAAVASNRIVPATSATPYGEVEVLVQNRGTETLINTTVQVSTGGGVISTNLTSLAPNAVRTVRVPVTNPPTNNAGTLRVESKVLLTGGVEDVKPANDRRAETYVAAGTR